jgi:peroxiredoxin
VADRLARWRRRAPRLLLEIVLLVAVVFAVRAWNARGAAHGDAPALRGRQLDGTPVALADARAEGPVLVHFWATWCGVCRMEEGNIEALARDHRVLTVAARSGRPEQVASYLAERDLELPVLVDPDGRLARRWGVSAYPTSFVVDADGRIRHAVVGFATQVGLATRLWLTTLL